MTCLLAQPLKKRRAAVDGDDLALSLEQELQVAEMLAKAQTARRNGGRSPAEIKRKIYATIAKVENARTVNA